jgi:hypothetical protein
LPEWLTRLRLAPLYFGQETPQGLALTGLRCQIQDLEVREKVFGAASEFVDLSRWLNK